jgi:hypothetical protein
MALCQGRRHSGGSEDEDGIIGTAFVFTPFPVKGRRAPKDGKDPKGRRLLEWTRRTELPLPNTGIMVRDYSIPPDTRLAGSTPVSQIGVHLRPGFGA